MIIKRKQYSTIPQLNSQPKTNREINTRTNINALQRKLGYGMTTTPTNITSPTQLPTPTDINNLIKKIGTEDDSGLF